MTHTHDLQEEPESTIGTKPEELIEDERRRHAAQQSERPARPDHPLREWLKGVTLPSTRDDVLEAAERNGAPKEALAFLQSLPEAIFESERGLDHVLSLLTDEDLPDNTRWSSPPPSEDGEPG
ncbi:MAG: DUF2795 domain-containing protein [Myxococcaceae bacterium]|nr:DUF2795 domain-containing protein [Myxococcaceae bacterium]